MGKDESDREAERKKKKIRPTKTQTFLIGE